MKVGKIHGRYEIIDEIGQGARGIVYRALNPQLNLQIALKILHENGVYNEEFVLRFLKQTQAVGALSHPNIVKGQEKKKKGGALPDNTNLLPPILEPPAAS